MTVATMLTNGYISGDKPVHAYTEHMHSMLHGNILRTKYDLEVAALTHVPLPDLADIWVLRSPLCTIWDVYPKQMDPKAGESDPRVC